MFKFINFNKRFFLFIVLFIVISLKAYSSEIEDYRFSLSLYKDGYVSQAESAFEDFITSYPDSIYKKKVIYLLALSKLKLKKYESAFDRLKLLADDNLFEKYKDVVYYYSLLASRLGRYKISEKYIKIFFSISQDNNKKDKLAYTSILNNVSMNKKGIAINKALSYINNKNFNKYSLQVEKILVDFFIDAKDYLNAYHIYTLMLGEKKLPNTTRKTLFHNYLLSLRELKKYDEAISFYQSNIHYYDKEVYKIMADVFYAKKDYENCVILLQAIFDKTKEEELLKKLAIVYNEWKGPKAAWQVLQDNMTQDSSVKVKELLAQFFYDDNLLEKSYDVLNTLSLESLDDYYFMLFFKISVTLNKEDNILRYDNQIPRLNRLDKEFRNNALYKIGEIYYNKREFEKASHYLRLWLDEFADDDYYDVVLYMQAICYKYLQEYEEAIVLLSKIQKIKKKDRLYYETFLEKGEVYFALQEYGEAINNYNIYLKNKKFSQRKEGALLQLANAYYNIKRYSTSAKLYQEYVSRYGESKYLYKKIANSLVNGNNYKGIISYFLSKKNIGDYPQYLIVYSYYKLEEYNKLLDYSSRINEKNSKYFVDLVYLKVLSFNKLKRNDKILDYYSAIRANIQKLSQDSKIIEIKKIFFTIFVKMARLDLSKELFNELRDTNLNFFKGEVFYRNLYFDLANKIFISLIKSNEYKKLTEREKNIMLKSLVIAKEFDNSLVLVNGLLSNNFDNIDFVLIKVDILSALKQIPQLKELEQTQTEPMLQESIEAQIKFLETADVSKYNDAILSIIKNKDIENKVVQWLYLKLIRIYYDKADYTTVLKLLDKIPKKTLTNLSAEFTYIKASAIMALGDEQKATSEFLKIYYVFSDDTFWVEKSIKELLALYKKNGDTKKYQQTKSLFEEKYFLLH